MDDESKAIMTPASIMRAVGNGLNTLGQFIPEDNDNYGVSRKGQTISSGIQTGLNTAGDIASSFGPIGGIVGGALKAGSFLTKGFTAIADAVKEHKNPRDERWDVVYNPKNAGTGISFGNYNDLIEMALGGFTKYDNGGEFKQYQAPTHEQGGQMIDKNKNPTSNPNKAVAEIEKKENSYKDYIFSDTLPYKGNITFAKQAKKINDKFKDRQDVISKNSLDIELIELMQKNEKIKQQVEQQTQLVQNIMRNGSYLPKATNGLKIPSELEGNVYNDWSNLMYSNSGIYPNDESGNMDAGNKITGKYKSSAHLFQDWVNNKYKALPKYGADGLWGKESQSAWDNYGDEYRKLISDKNSVGIGTGVAPINKPLFNYKDDNFYPSQDINGIDIERPGDDYGAGIAVNSQTKINKNNPSALEIAGYGIKGAELLGHAIQAFKKPELVNPVYNPEENAIKNLMAKRKIDNQDLLNELELQNTATKEDIANNSTSVPTMIANLQKLHANDVDSIAKITSQTQQVNNAYRSEEAQLLNNLGQQKVKAQNDAEDLNAKAKGNVQNQRDKFLKESIGGLGDFLLNKDYVNKDNNFQMNILKSKGINFTATDYKDWNKAEVNVVKFTGELESETDIAKRKAKMEEVHQKFLAKGGTEEDWQSNSIAQGLTNKYLK